MDYLKVLIAASIWVFIVLFLVINKRMRDDLITISNITIYKKIKIKNAMAIFSVLVILFYSGAMIKGSIEEIIKLKRDDLKEEKELREYDEKLKLASNQMQKYYEVLEEINTNIEKCKKPYIPNGFSHIEGEWNTGFVIEDENKNQFVWIPCSNVENNEKIPVLCRDLFSSSSVSFFSCREKSDIEEFWESSLENGGFYISRYEIGNEDGKPVSKAECEVYNNVTVSEAEKLSKNMYSDINSRLMNGYSYDTAVKFIKDEIDINNIPNSTGKTGNKAYKNIYDLVDNMGEWTEEERDLFFIYRKTLNLKEEFILSDRLSDSEEYKDKNLGFRTILYK